jgi:hypothetical protein
VLIPLKDSNPLRWIGFPYVTVALIAACVLAFLWQLSLGATGNRIVYALGAIPAVLIGDRALPPDLALVPAPLTLVTSMFLHGSWLHLGGNMLFLWIFGDNVEDAMGHVRFLVAAQHRDLAMRQHLAQPPGVHLAGDRDARAFGVGPAADLAAGEVRLVRHQRRRGVASHPVLADGRQRGAVTGQQPQRIVGHRAAGTEQDH